MKNIINKTLLGTLILLLFATGATASGRCYKDECFKREEPREVIHDLSQQFNETAYWLEENSRTNKMQVCSKRLMLEQNFHDLQQEMCFPAKIINNPSKALPDGARCYYADGLRKGLILCRSKDGSLKLYSRATKHCSPDVIPQKPIVGVIENKPTYKNGGSKTCKITIDSKNNQSFESLPTRSTVVHRPTLADYKRVQNASPRTLINHNLFRQ